MSKRRALLIGVPKYRVNCITPLPFIRNDLKILQEALESSGFKVESIIGIGKHTATPGEIRGEIHEFCRKAEKSDILLLWFSGHGVHFEGNSYLVPYDARIDDPDLKPYLISVEDFRKEFENSKATTILFFIDACREGIELGTMSVSPFQAWSPEKLKLSKNRDVAFIYSCSPGQVSSFIRKKLLKKGEINKRPKGYSLFSRAVAKAIAESPATTFGETIEKIQEILNELADLYEKPQQTIDPKSSERLLKKEIFEKAKASIQDIPSLSVNNFSVNNIFPEYIFLDKNSLTARELQCVYDDVWTPFPANFTAITKKYLEQKKKEAIKAGITFDNNLSYSLYTISVEREQDLSGFRHNRYTLHLRPTDYFSFVFPNLALDEMIEIAGNKTTPRKELGLAHNRIRIENFPDYLCHFHIGCGTVFITSDNKIVISIRSRLEFVAGGDKYHLSAAEGMLRPVDEQNGKISPFFTSMRSLKDELGLEKDVDFLEDDIWCIGIMLDTLRAQPFCIFYAKSALISFDELRAKWQLRAKDKHENRDIIGMKWNEETARILLGGSMDYRNTLVEVASNHAQTGFMLAALHEFGMEFT
ncbi:MAG: caspase family protein [Methanothrix sp.]